MKVEQTGKSLPIGVKAAIIDGVNAMDNRAKKKANSILDDLLQDATMDRLTISATIAYVMSKAYIATIISDGQLEADRTLKMWVECCDHAKEAATSHISHSKQ